MILHIPHSSTEIPTEFQSEYTKYKDDFMDYITDTYSDELFEHWNSAVLCTPYSRLFCDVERFPEDDMDKIGQGRFYSRDNHGNMLREISPEARTRGTELYNTHHQELNSITKKLLNLYPEVFVVDCHTFSPAINSPDFCIGTNPNTPKEVIHDIAVLLEHRGYTIGINLPYAGAIVPTDYTNSKKVQAIMIEVNKKLYLDGVNKGHGFNKTQLVVNEILDIISKYEIRKDK